MSGYHYGLAVHKETKMGRPCKCCDKDLILEIYYDWTGTGQRDLDTGTTFLETKVGYACGFGDDYIQWSGDNVSSDSFEVVYIFITNSLNDGLWNDDIVVDLAAGWYAPANGYGPAIVRALIRGKPETEQSKTINPGVQFGCATTSVGFITINSDGTFILE